MNIILDTCLFIRNDQGQNRVPGFDYELLESLINDKNNKIYVSGFSLPEIYMLKNYSSIDDLMIGLADQDAYVASYDFSKLHADFSKYDLINKYAAGMFYHLTEFLEFFVLEVMHEIADDLDSLCAYIHNCTDVFYNGIGKTNLENCTEFMKNKAVDYIVEIIQRVLKHYEKPYSKDEAWSFIAKSKIGSILSRDICKQYLRYARFLKCLFKKKIENKANKISLTFGFNDLLIANATEYDYVVLTSDKDLSRYLLKYGNNENKNLIFKLWKMMLSPADF